MPFFSIRPGAIFNIRAKRGVPFLYRKIITHGYVNGGYANSVAWRNVNSLNHSTDTTTNHGDLMQFAGNYMGGAHGKDIAFIFGTNGSGNEAVGATTANTSCYNMRTNAGYARTTSMNTPGNVGNGLGLMDCDEDGFARYSWISGGNSTAQIYKFDLVTEISLAAISTSFPQEPSEAAGGSGMMHETFGYWWISTAPTTTGKLKFTYATETQSVPSITPGQHSNQKGISSKLGVGYAGNEGTYLGGNFLRKTSFPTETVVSTASIAKPVQNSGEENFDMGQDHQYMIGMYNGAQLNTAWRFNYATDSGYQGGASMQPTGTQSGTGSSAGVAIPGRSSAAVSWKAN